MKPPALRLTRATSLEHALRLLDGSGDEVVKVIAGGQSLMPLLNLRMASPDHLVDIGRLDDLRGVRTTSDTVEVGALTTHAQLAADPALGSVGVLAACANHIGHVAIRHRGTLGGSLVHADPAAELPAAAVLLQARAVCRSQAGEREIPAAELFLGPYTTALREDEVLVSVRFPRLPATARHGFVEFAPREGDYARAGAVALLTPADDGTLASARAVLFAVGSTPVDVSAALAGVVGRAPVGVDWDDVAAGAVRTAEGLRPGAGRLARVALSRALRRAALPPDGTAPVRRSGERS
jgi:CO/xanthine dehydrogenase FAD-binding subunit